MKTASDPRHQHRIHLIQQLFSYSFRVDVVPEVVGNIVKEIEQIDEKIHTAAPEWPIDKISRIDLAILRLAVYELIIVKEEPPKVVIDEAVEVAKEFGNATSPGFINGVLGTILKHV